MDNLTSKKYIKGFNASYFIAKYKPILIESLLKSEINNDFMKGMKDGKLTFDLEKTKVISKTNTRLQELKQNRPKNRNRDFKR